MITRRTPLPDILKGIAVMLMIQVHLMQLFATEEIFISLAGKISLFLGGPPAAPVFMVVMGYFMAKSGKSHFQQTIRGLKLIGLGFLLNFGMNFQILIKIFTGASHQNPWPYIFGVDILFLAGISILVIALVRLVFRNQPAPYAVLTLLAVLTGQFLPEYSGSQEWIRYLQAFFWGSYEWSYFPVFPWLAYPLTGFLFNILNEKYNLTGLTPKGRSYLMITAFIILVVTFSFGFQISANLQVYYHHSVIFFLWVQVFLIFWILVLNLIFTEMSETHVSEYLKWIGKNVTAFYVVQWLMIGNLATTFYRSQGWPALAYWFLIIMLSTTLVVFTWEKVKRYKEINNQKKKHL
jgi:uncharacterized membrane protein